MINKPKLSVFDHRIADHCLELHLREFMLIRSEKALQSPGLSKNSHFGSEGAGWTFLVTDYRCLLVASYFAGTFSRAEKIPQVVVAAQKMYMGAGCASYAMRGPILWPSLARNWGAPNAVAALLTSKIVEFATTVKLNAQHTPNLQRRKNMGKATDS